MILVVGGTGTIGTEVVRLLHENGTDFRLFCRDPDAARGSLGTGVDIYKGDLMEPESVFEAMQGVRKLFLVTPLHLDQFTMKSTAIRAAISAGVEHIVMSTGIDAHPNSEIRIRRLHSKNQDEVKASGITYTFLQPGYFMQNMLMLADSIRRQQEIRLPVGDGRIGFVDARDIAAVAVAALVGEGHENQEYTITGEEALHMNDVAAIFSDIVGCQVKYIDISLETRKLDMIKSGMPGELADMMNEFYALGPSGQLATLTDTVVRTTGRRARSMRQFAENFSSAFLR